MILSLYCIKGNKRFLGTCRRGQVIVYIDNSQFDANLPKVFQSSLYSTTVEFGNHKGKAMSIGCELVIVSFQLELR